MFARRRPHPVPFHHVARGFALALVLIASPLPCAWAGGHAMHDAMPMTDDAMRAWVDRWYAAHPPVGVSGAHRAAAAAVVTVQSFFFDADANAGTQIDTVKIHTGESVEWDWVNGSHTVTNGTGFADPTAGTLFDAPMTISSQTFVFTFTDAGTYRYFCRPHEGFNMKGVVVVSSSTGVTPLPDASGTIGFTREPSPNPTTRGVDFEFALRAAGRARIDVYDVRGARVATVTDGALAAGGYRGRWDGTRADGRAADPGVYWLRMSVPGASQSRRVVVSR